MKRPIFVKHLFVALLAVLVMTGCATSHKLESRKQERYGAYMALSPDLKAAVDQGRVKAGMNMDAVYIAWGKPNQVVNGGNAAVENITWLYEGVYFVEGRYWGRYGMRYYYSPANYVKAQVVFVNGVVQDWQTFPDPSY